MAMGRKRRSRKDLPERVYFRGKSYHFVDKKGNWHNLGRDFHQAMINLADLDHLTLPSYTLSSYIDRYIVEEIPKKAVSTQKKNLQEIERLRAVFGKMRPESVKPKDIYGYMDRRPRVAANREKGLFSHVFTCLIKWGIVEENPCQKVKRNPEIASTRYIEDHEYQAVYAIMPPPIQKAMDIALLTGLRQGDILRLTRANSRSEGLLVETNKTGRKLLFEWTEDLTEAINRVTATVSSLWLVYNKAGQPYSSEGFRTQWGKYMRKAIKEGKLDPASRFKFKDLRGKAGSDSTDDNLLGHASRTTLYRHYKRKPIAVRPTK